MAGGGATGGLRRGRRPSDSPQARDSILAAARAAFAQQGYAATTLRAVARLAGVDASLVTYYFASKEQLFVSAMELPLDPSQIAREAVSHGVERLGESLTRGVLTAWSTPSASLAMRGMLQASMTREAAWQLLREYAVDQIARPIARLLDGPDAEYRASLAAAHLMGLAMGRYVVGVEALASVSIEQMTADVAPVLQHYLTGELGSGPRASSDGRRLGL